MLLQNRNQIAVAVLFGCAIVIATIALFPSTQLSINDSCQISGPIQKLKLFVQGKHYWAKQFQFLDQEVQDLETQPDRIRNTQQMVGEMTKEVLERHRQFMEEQYSKHPELRPSRGQVVAGELRKQADAIEHAELLEKLEQLYAQRVTTLKSCRSIILEAAQLKLSLAGEGYKNHVFANLIPESENGVRNHFHLGISKMTGTLNSCTAKSQ